MLLSFIERLHDRGSKKSLFTGCFHIVLRGGVRLVFQTVSLCARVWVSNYDVVLHFLSLSCLRLVVSASSVGPLGEACSFCQFLSWFYAERAPLWGGYGVLCEYPSQTPIGGGFSQVSRMTTTSLDIY